MTTENTQSTTAPTPVVDNNLNVFLDDGDIGDSPQSSTSADNASDKNDTSNGTGADSLFESDEASKIDGVDDVVDLVDVPENYDFGDIAKTVDPDILETYSQVAKELKLDNESASKIMNTVMPKIAESQTKQFEAVKNQWKEETKNDKEIGGSNIVQTQKRAIEVLNRYGNKPLVDLLGQSGLSKHPEFLRFLNKIGQRVTVDSKPIQGNSPPAGAVDKDPMLTKFLKD